MILQDPDPYKQFRIRIRLWSFFVVLLLVVLLLVALLGTGDDSFIPLRAWYRGVSYDRDIYPDFSRPSLVTSIFKGPDPDPKKLKGRIRIRKIHTDPQH